MKKLILLFAIGMMLLALFGCNIGKVSPFLIITATPNGGHPPFSPVITAVCSAEGGAYTLTEEGKQPILSTDGVFTVTVDSWPYKATVTWTDGHRVARATVHVELIDQPPVIRRPWITGTYGVPFWRTLIDLRYDGGRFHDGPCITDPDGDAWKVTSITVQCENKEEPDTLFYPSIYGIKEFHVDGSSGCNTVDIYPAAVWYPGYTAGIDDDTGLPFSISSQDGWFWDSEREQYWSRGYPVLEDFTSPLFRAQNATITITAEDDLGKSTTESFIFPIIAYSG